MNRIHINHDTATNDHSKEHEESDATEPKEGLCFVHFKYGPQAIVKCWPPWCSQILVKLILVEMN